MEQWENDAAGALSAEINASALSLSLEAGQGASFPSLASGDFFWATIASGGSSEIVKITATTGDTFTIERAQQGTVAATWPIGSTVELRVTRETLNSLRPLTTSDVAAAGFITSTLSGDFQAVGSVSSQGDGAGSDPTFSLVVPSGDTWTIFADDSEADALAIARNGNVLVSMRDDALLIAGGAQAIAGANAPDSGCVLDLTDDQGRGVGVPIVADTVSMASGRRGVLWFSDSDDKVAVRLTSGEVRFLTMDTPVL